MSATTEIRERPILFSGPMVRAILDGRKTQTRRVLTLKRRGGRGGPVVANPAYVERWKNEPAHAWASECPYGAPGDRLWVRETWTPVDTDGETWASVGYRADDHTLSHDCTMEQAEHHQALIERLEVEGDGDMNWRPSIHMPRWASRLTLELTDVRVERLQDISEPDAFAEGCVSAPCAKCDESGNEAEGIVCGDCAGEGRLSCSDNYRALWNLLNAKRGFGWDANPWVWVLSFRAALAASGRETEVGHD